jgi:hypothetical protein
MNSESIMHTDRRHWIIVATGLALLFGLGLFAVGNQPAAPPRGVNPKALAKAAREAYEQHRQLLAAGHLRSCDEVYLWSVRWMEAEKEASQELRDQVSAAEAHRDRMKDLATTVQQLPDSHGPTIHAMRTAGNFDVLQADNFIVNAIKRRNEPKLVS